MEGRDWGEVDTGKGLERSTKGFILPLGGGASRVQTFQKQKQKTKTKTKNPKYHVELRERQRNHAGLQPLSEEQ